MLVLTTFDLDEYVFGALKAGASGFLLKDTPPADLLAGIRIVAGGEALLSPSITRHLIEEFVRRPAAGDRRRRRARGLTERETEVLGLVAKGWSNAEIAASLFMSAGDGQDPRQPAADEARRPRPGPARRRSRTRRAW